jgi:hypothetical protein
MKNIAMELSWVVAEQANMDLPDTLVDSPGDHDDAVDHAENGEARDTSTGFVAQATNWDALLDTAGIPTEGPAMAACGTYLAESCSGNGECPCLQQGGEAGCAEGCAEAYCGAAAECGVLPASYCPTDGSSCGMVSTCARPAGQSQEQELPDPLSKPLDPNAQKKAKLRQRAGRGVEGSDEPGPGFPMDPSSKFDWDHLAKLPGNS